MRWTKAHSSSHVVATEDGVGRENLDRLCDARIRQVITRLVLYWAEKAFLHVMQIPLFLVLARSFVLSRIPRGKFVTNSLHFTLTWKQPITKMRRRRISSSNRVICVPNDAPYLAVLSRRVQLHTPLIHPFWKESLASFPSRNFQIERLCVNGPLLGRPHQQMPNKWKRILRGKPVHGCCLIM